MNAKKKKKFYSFQTHFVFTKFGSEVQPDRDVAISLLEKWSWTLCMRSNEISNAQDAYLAEVGPTER